MFVYFVNKLCIRVVFVEERVRVEFFMKIVEDVWM